jgi:hypothetical protein
MADKRALWLIRPKPQPLEALSSWIARLAVANGQRLHSFCTDHWHGQQIWTRDIDHYAPQNILDTLAARTGAPAQRCLETSFKAFSGTLFDQEEPNGCFSYIRPLGVYHRTRRAFGLQICPECLSVDELPYFRLTWRLSLFPHCTRHGSILLDRCPECEAPIVPHRGSFLACDRCQTPYASMDQPPASSSALALQYLNEKILLGAPVVMPARLSGSHPLAYFRLLQCLATRLLTGKRRGRFRRSVSHLLREPLTVIPTGRKIQLRFLTPAEGSETLRAIACLLEGWPWKFIGAAQEAGLWHSWAMASLSEKHVPFEFATMSDRFLRIDPNETKREGHLQPH